MRKGVSGAVRSRWRLVVFGLSFAMASLASGAARAQARTPQATSARPFVPAGSAERNAVVEIFIQDRRVCLGFVLEGDGRILTPLSPLGPAVGISAKYADGSRTKLRVLHSDRGWDLALLTPDDQRWTQGLLASKIDPFQDGGALRLLRLERRATKLVSLPVPHRENLTGGDAALLAQALTFGPVLTAADLGAPILDAGGSVVAMISTACLPTILDHCKAIQYAVPTSELRRFLDEGMRARNLPVPWLGLTVSSLAEGSIPATRIQSVLPRSPASSLGLRAGEQGDLLLAINSIPVGSPKDLAELLRSHRTGDRISLLLLAEGRYREVRVTLSSYPDAERPSTGAVLSPPDLGY